MLVENGKRCEMKKILILSTVLATALFANSIRQDNQFTHAKDKSVQKSTDQSATDEKSKSITKEKGQEVNQGSETSKSKEKEQTVSTETSKSDSKSSSMKRVIDMQATMMMPEVDFLVGKYIDKYTKDPRIFMDWLPIREADLPESFKSFAQDEAMMANQNYMYYQDEAMTQQIENQWAMTARLGVGGANGLNSARAETIAMTNLLMDDFSLKYHKLFNEFFSIYGLPSAKVSARTYEVPQLYLSVSFYKSKFIVDVSGGWNGNFVFTIKNFFDNNLKFFNKKYILQTQPQEGRFILMKNSQPVIEISPVRESHFYGDLILMRDFGGEMSNKNVTVVDRVLDADGINLAKKNKHNKFDDYFKKLMKIYLEAFSSVNISKNGTYSLEEIQYRVREYLYKKITGKDDFLERYLRDPSDFWKPRGKDLAKYPRVQTSYNDVIFSKSEGYILNQKISFNIESSDSVQENFNKAMREAKSEKFAESVKKAINQFQRENKQDMARLAMQLANKIASNKNYLTKQDLINKAGTSTDLLKSMLDIVK